MSASHAVQRLCFEVHADSATQGHSLGERVSALCAQQLAAVLAEELSAYCSSQVQLYLPQLVLELPPVAARRLEADLPDLFRRALRMALTQLPATGITAPVRAAASVSVLTVLAYFLRHGHLPWQANTARFSLREAFQTALTSQPAAFRALVMQLGRTAAVRQRLAWQLGRGQVEQLIALLEPVHATFLREYLVSTLATHRRQPLVPVTETSLRNMLHELILTDLLTRTGSVFNRRAFVERQVRQLATRYNLSFEQLLAQLIELAPTAAPFAAQAALPLVLRTIYQERIHGKRAAGRLASGSNSGPRAAIAGSDRLAFVKDSGTGGTGSVRTVADLLAYFLRYGSLPAEGLLLPEQLSAGLPALLTHGWPALRVMLQAAGPAAPGRLARLLPEPLLQQLLGRAVPGQVRAWLGVLDADDTPPGQRPRPRAELWAHTLQYLLQAEPQQLKSPAFRFWLRQQLLTPGPYSQTRPHRLPKTAIRKLPQAWELVAQYLTAGDLSVSGTGGQPSFTFLRTALGQVMQHQPRLLRAFLQRPLAAVVLLRLVRLTDFTALAVSLTGRARTNRTQYLHRLLSTLDSFQTHAVQQSGAVRIVEFLKAAYITCHLRPAAGRAASRVLLEQLAASYRLPWASVIRKARALVQLHPALLTEPLFGVLLATNQAITTNQKAGNSDFNSDSQVPADQKSSQKLLLPRSDTAVALKAHEPTALPAAGALPGQVRRWPLAAPVLAAQQLMKLRPAAGNREVLFHYLQHGTSPAWWPQSATVRQRQHWLHQTVRQQPAQLLAFLRAHANHPALLIRLATLASLPLLARLLTSNVGLPHRAAPALAALDQPDATGNPDQPSRWLLFLRTAYLTFHLQARHLSAASRLRLTQQLAAANGVPWQALLRKAARLLAQVPLLSTDAFFASLPLPSKSSGKMPLVRRVSSALPARSVASRPARAPLPTAPSTFAATALYPEAQPPEQRLPQLPTGVAARDLVFHILLHPGLPWWAPAGLTNEQQRRLLAQVAHYYRAELQSLMRAHQLASGFQQRLAALAGFGLLHQLTGRPGQNQPASPLLHRLDQLLTGRNSDAPVMQFLRQAYLAAALQPNSTGVHMLATTVRQQASASGFSWRTVLLRVAWLHRQLQAVATLPFFAALLAAHAPKSVPGRPLRNLATRPTVFATSPVHLAPSYTAASKAYQSLEHYLRTGEFPVAAAASVAFLSKAENLPEGHIPVTASSESARWKLLLQPTHQATLLAVRPLLTSATVRSRLLAELTEKESWLLLRQLYPVYYRLAAPLITDWLLLARQGIVRLRASAIFEVLLALMQATPTATWRADTLVQHLLDAEEALWPQASAASRNQSRPGLLLAEVARRGLVLRSTLGALLTVRHEALAAARKVPPLANPIPFLTEENTPSETVYILNAGLVLIWPFMTMLFDRLGLLENQQFRDEPAQQRAVLLLQFLAAGTQEVPEYELPLNKLLCGLPQARPLPRELNLTATETELSESLLKAVIARWEILKNTSVAGLRETFLLRPGKLEWLPERITLTVETKTLDILLDSRPWSISIIKLPWMLDPLYVNWR